jgi:hypothetical protein
MAAADIVLALGTAAGVIAAHAHYGDDLPVRFWVYLVIAGALADYVFSPIEVLAHELGHAVTAVALTGERVYIEVGEAADGVAFSLGKIDVRVTLRHNGGGSCSLPNRLAPWKLGLIAIAGPLASAALTAMCVAGVIASRGHGLLLVMILVVAGLVAACGVINILPTTVSGRYGGGELAGQPTDGLVLLWALGGHSYDRHGDEPTPGERFVRRTSPAFRAVLTEAARAAGDDPITPAHLLRAIAHNGGPATELLAIAHVRTEPIPADAQRAEQPRFTAAAACAIDRSPGYLSLRGDRLVEPEHLLLALLAEPEIEAAGIDRPALRADVLAHFA